MMDRYDIRKDEKQWQLMKEGSPGALKTFETKKAAVKYAREYLRKQGGVLRIWKSDGALQEERTYEIEVHRFYDGVLEGVGDATKAAGQFLPVAGKFVSKGIYEAGYYAAYGVVFGATMLARSIP
jgi:hypothetical protein